MGNYDDIAARRHAQDVAIDDFLTDQVALEAGRKLVIKRIDRKASDIATMDALVDFADHLLLPDR